MKKFISIVVIILVLLLGTILLVYRWYQNNIEYTNPSEITIEINPGDGLETIADKLAADNAIANSSFFQIYAFMADSYRAIQPGIHTIPAGTTIDQILILFADNPRREITITIPEGLTTASISQLVSQNLDLTADIFLAETKQSYHLTELPMKPADDSLEGFLFPDTYRFLNDSTSDQVVIRFLQNFSKQWPQTAIDEYRTDLSDYEILILASIIEKEAANSEERRIISEILQSRLENGEPLAVNATLNYVLDDPMAVFTEEEIYYDSPYNTYQNKGLPPTPICNPGLDSIMAVIEPTTNDYYFYLHDSDGQIHYAKTLAEHNENVAEYLN